MTTTRMNGAVRDPRFVLLATSLGVLLAQIDTSVVNLGLKSIAHDLNAGVSEMQWVVDAYNVVYATLLLTGGTLGDIYGRRILGSVFAAYAGQQANVVAGFMPGLRAAMIAAASAELLGAIIAAAVIRSDSLHAKR